MEKNKKKLEPLYSQSIITNSYTNLALQAHNTRSTLLRRLLEGRKLPQIGWSDHELRLFMNSLSDMDSNNYPNRIGVGEREGRFLCNLVQERNFDMSHGIGRSGDLRRDQPKAAGSSILASLTTYLCLDACRVSGLEGANNCLIIPCATGMSLTLCLMSLRESRPDAKYVIILRIDQRTCMKCIYTAGYTPIVINGKIEGDSIRTDLNSLKEKMKNISSDSILAVLSTTSCFAPRLPDNVLEIGIICNTFGVPHIINNAYGIQARSTTKLISSGLRNKRCRIDCIVSSLDKNFCVPVGGALVLSPDKEFISNLAQLYPGRASISPSMDLFLTLMSLGVEGWSNKLLEREKRYKQLKELLSEVAIEFGEKVLETSENPISIGLTLNSLSNLKDGPSTLGSELFTRNVTGHRICVGGIPGSKGVVGLKKKTVGGVEFNAYGTHHDLYPHSYITVSAAIGQSEEEIMNFCKHLRSGLTRLQSKLNKA